MEQELVSCATKRMAKIQHEVGTEAKALILSGDVPKVTSQAAKKTGEDLVIVGCRAIGGRFGTNAYGIIHESSVPVLSV